MKDDQPKFRQMAKARLKLERDRAQRAALPTALIVCEGEKTEPIYVEGLVRYLGIHPANVRVVRGGGKTDPVGVVQRTHEFFRANNDYDRVFALVDGDQGSIDRARELAQRRLRSATGKSLSVDLIVSRPCFELWLLLHLTYTDQPFRSCDEVTRLLQDRVPTYDKSNREVLETLCDHLNDAIGNSMALEEANKRSGATDSMTDMHLLGIALKGMVPNP